MNIYVDESGSFVSSSARGSWNVVAAVAAAEASRRQILDAVHRLKLASATKLCDEVKLNSVLEEHYLRFLSDLAGTHVLLFATGTDAGVNSTEKLMHHQRMQVAMIRKNLPRMKYEGGKQGIALLADQLERIPPQLYAQLVCQVDLLHDVVSRSINYFVQRIPAAVGAFRWRIDQKNTSKTTYEEAFEKMAPALLQTRSFGEPALRIEGFDYRHMAAFEYAKGATPEYLEIEYGLRVEHALNLGKILRDDLKFEDSKRNVGIQVADLLASGLRRCLRGGFRANNEVAAAIGSLTLQNQRGSHPIHLISFAEESEADGIASEVVKVITKNCRAMLARHSSREDA